MKSLFHRFMTRFGFSSRATAFFVALHSVIFFAANSLASQQVRGFCITYRPQVSAGVYATGYRLWYYYLQGTPTPTVYDAWPFLSQLKYSYTIANGLSQWWPYGYAEPGYGNDPPYIYQHFDTYFDLGTVPDDWTSDDVDEINRAFNNLSPSEQAACTGSFTAANVTSNGETTKVLSLNKRTPGTVVNDGVCTYNDKGNLVISYPDNTGYASGYRLQPDGSVTPIYYHFENGSATEVPYIPTQEYSALEYDPETQHYSLNVPDYREKLDLIANKIDGITLSYDPVINVSPPSVTVNPAVTVSPDVTVNVDSADLSDIEASLVGIGTLLDSSLGTDSGQQPTFTNDLGLTQSEQTMISNFRAWETGIPVLGSTLDFGLTAIFGRLPVVGQDFEWMDIQPLSSSSGPSSILSGLRIRVDLTQYRNLLLALRGWLIIAEAIFFGILTWKLIREALAV